MTEDELLELSDPQYDFLESSAKHTGFVAGFGVNPYNHQWTKIISEDDCTQVEK